MEQQTQQPSHQEHQAQSNFPSTKNFLANPKLPLLVAIVVILLAIGGVLLLRTLQALPPQSSFPPFIRQPPSIERIVPNEAPIGAEVSVIGSGFTPTKNSLQFGYDEFDAINDLASPDGKTTTFTVPVVFSGCSPKVGCQDRLTRPIPGQTYEVAVINANGMSNRVLFTVAKDTTSVEIDTSTWQTYRNEEFGFEVRYL